MGKRKHRKAFPPPKASPSPSNAHVALSPPPLPAVKFGEFKLTGITGPFTSNPVTATTTTSTTTTTATAADSMGGEVGGGDGEGEWQTAKRHKKLKQKYPSFEVSPTRLNSAVKLSDIQSLALWLLADGTAPQWLLVKNKHEIRGAVVVMVPGLEMAMFDGDLDLTSDIAAVDGGQKEGGEEDLGVVVDRNDLAKSAQTAQSSSPSSKPGLGWGEHSFYPQELKRTQLQACVRGFADMFSHVWPVNAPGDERGRVYSVITGFLNTPIPKGNSSQESDKYTTSQRIGITRLVMPFGKLVENEYPVHSAHATASLVAEATKAGWVETDLSMGNGRENNEGGSITEAKTIYAMDCEMVQTKQGLELARISLLSWDGETVYDTLVKPENLITDYLTTRYSGITKAMLDPVTTSLKDVQNHLLKLFNNDTILVGQSLNADLGAIRIAHPHIVDTSVIYDHPRGPPYRASLRWLSKRYLGREIQKGGSNGHDSIEDAKACLDLLKLKLERGLEYGTSNTASESIFKRLSRMRPVARIGGIVDYGAPDKWWSPGAARVIQAKDDAEVATGIIKSIRGDPPGTRDGHPKLDLVWGRMRTLEALRGWNKPAAPDEGPSVPIKNIEPNLAALSQGVKNVTAQLKQIYDSLPPCTAFIVYSGTGDPRELRRLQDMQREYKRQYTTMKWDELTVKWTDTENQELAAATKLARQGIAFLTVK